MNTPNPRAEWPALSKALHWLIAALIFSMAWIGLTMGDLPNGPDKIATYALHKSLGISVLALMVVRIAWRLYAGAPSATANTPRAQRLAAHAIHGLLYLLLLAMPLTGWLLNSAAGFPLQWFGVINLPALTDANDALKDWATAAHVWLFWGLATLVLAHAGAALFHHLFQGDDTLARMLPRGWLRAPSTENSDA